MSYYDRYNELKNEMQHYIWSSSAAYPWSTTPLPNGSGGSHSYTSTGTQIDRQKISNDYYMSEISKLRNKIEQSESIIYKLTQENIELKETVKKLNKFTRFDIMDI